jgi:hypothetical protein
VSVPKKYQLIIHDHRKNDLKTFNHKKHILVVISGAISGK